MTDRERMVEATRIMTDLCNLLSKAIEKINKDPKYRKLISDRVGVRHLTIINGGKE